MIHSIGHMFASDAQMGLDDGRWVTAVASPFHDGLFARIGNAFAVIAGRAYAVRWPKAGELEDVLGVPVKGAGGRFVSSRGR